MSFGESFGTCMRKYASFSGRARRSEFWWFFLAVQLILIPFSIALGIAFVAASGDLIDLMEDETVPSFRQFVDGVEWDKLIGPGLLLGAVCLFLFIPALAVTARRLHDIGLSGWFMLVGLVPLGLGSAAMIIMCVIDSQARDNDWGPDPKSGERPLWGHVPATSPPPPPPSA